MAQRLDGDADRTVFDPYRSHRMRADGRSPVVFGRRLHDDLGDGFGGHQVDGFLVVHAHLLSHDLNEVVRDAPHRRRLYLDAVSEQHGTRLRHEHLEREGVLWVCHSAQRRSRDWSVSTKPA